MTRALLDMALLKARKPFISRYACVLPRPWAQRDGRLVDTARRFSRAMAADNRASPMPTAMRNLPNCKTSCSVHKILVAC
jgi:hypothetical protein